MPTKVPAAITSVTISVSESIADCTSAQDAGSMLEPVAGSAVTERSLTASWLAIANFI